MDDTREDHDWNLDEIVSEPKPGIAGEYAYVCACGATKTEYPLFEGLKVSFDYDNYIHANAAVVNGGLVVLNVYLEGTEIDVETIQIKFAYDADRLTQVSDTWNLFESGKANCRGGLGVIALSGKKGDTSAHSAVTINGKILVGQIVFRVDDYVDVLDPNADIDTVDTTIEFVSIDATAPVDANEDGDYDAISANFECDSLDITVEKLGAISVNDKKIGSNDLSAIKDLINNAEAYDARADVDQNGYIDLFDYYYLFDYIAYEYDYERFVAIAAIGPVEG